MRSPWKSRFAGLFVALVGVSSAGVASAQDYSFGWNPRSGDAWVDDWAGDMNRYGSRYRDPFVDEMVRYYGAPRDLVTDLLVDRRWAPGDVYLACSIASIIGRPCRYVVDTWERDHGQGWGAVAQNLGIKPGSAEFHRLKKGFVPSYDRWGRTITIDSDLERDFPGRGKGAQGKTSKAKPAQASSGNGKSKGASHGQGNGQAKGNSGKDNSGKDNSGKDNGKNKGNDKH